MALGTSHLRLNLQNQDSKWIPFPIYHTSSNPSEGPLSLKQPMMETTTTTPQVSYPFADRLFGQHGEKKARHQLQFVITLVSKPVKAFSITDPSIMMPLPGLMLLRSVPPVPTQDVATF